MHPLYNLEIELCLPILDPIIGFARRRKWIKSNEDVEEERKGLADSDALKSGDAGLGKSDLELA